MKKRQGVFYCQIFDRYMRVTKKNNEKESNKKESNERKSNEKK